MHKNIDYHVYARNEVHHMYMGELPIKDVDHRKKNLEKLDTLLRLDPT